jgi:predicted RNA methylase
MKATATLQPQIDAATAYEALMVPALFGQWATQVADAARIQPGQRVLDVACGTGVLGREVVSRTGAPGLAVGLDPNPACSRWPDADGTVTFDVSAHIVTVPKT